MSANIKLTKTQISKIIQSGCFLGVLLSKIPGPLMKVAVSLTKNILALLVVTTAVVTTAVVTTAVATTVVVTTAVVTAAVVTINRGIQNKLHGKASIKQLKTRQKSKKVDFYECY